MEWIGLDSNGLWNTGIVSTSKRRNTGTSKEDNEPRRINYAE